MPDHYPDKTNKGISASKFMGREDDGSGALTTKDFSTKTGKLANITRRVTIRVGKVEKRSAINAEKITKVKNITQLRKENVDKKIGGSSSGLLDALNGINDNVNGMLAILSERQRFEKKVASDERKAAEKQGRGASEKKLESKAFDGLKGIAKKVLAPAMSLWDRLWEFLTTILLGRVAIKLWDWISDKKNQDKIKAIGRLFKDWWPAMLTGFVLFGTGMGRFITWMGAKLVAWGWTLLKTVIPVLWKAITAMGPWGWAALGAGAAIYGTGKLLGKDKVVENETVRADTSREALEEAESTEDLSAGDREAIVQGTRLKDAGGGGSLNTMPDQFNDPLGLRNDPTGMGGMGLNQGGQVPGSGNSDSVSAKLTPGEFVVSAPAVQQWGADTFSAMNAMGGGGNTGSISRGFSEGGLVSKNMWNPMNWFGGSGSGEKKGVTDKDKSKLTPEKGGISRNAKALLNTIRWAEGTLKPGGYNTWFGGRTDMDLTKMTIDEVVAEQKRRLSAGEATYGKYTSAAVGAYQMMLPEQFAPRAGLNGSSLFTPENQDKMAIAAYMKGRLSNKEIDSPISRETIAKISGVWSSLPTMSGASAHGQPVKKYSDLENVYNKNLKSLDPNSYSAATTSIALGKGSTSVPGGGGSRGKNQRAWWDVLGWAGTGKSDQQKIAEQKEKKQRAWWDVLGWAGTGKRKKKGENQFSETGINIGLWGEMEKKSQINAKSYNINELLKAQQSNKTNIKQPQKRTTTIAYDQEMAAQQNASMPGSAMNLPSINPSAMISPPKIAVLGISV